MKPSPSIEARILSDSRFGTSILNDAELSFYLDIQKSLAGAGAKLIRDYKVNKPYPLNEAIELFGEPSSVENMVLVGNQWSSGYRAHVFGGVALMERNGVVDQIRVTSLPPGIKNDFARLKLDGSD